MTCRYGTHEWNITKLQIKCIRCGEIVPEPSRDHGDKPLPYTKDQYDF